MDSQIVSARDQKSSYGRERLRITEDRLATLWIRKQFGQPCHRRNKLHTYADESGTSQQK